MATWRTIAAISLLFIINLCEMCFAISLHAQSDGILSSFSEKDFPSAVSIRAFDLSEDGRTIAIGYEVLEGERIESFWVALWSVTDKNLLASKRFEGPISRLYETPQYSFDIRFIEAGDRLVVLTGKRIVVIRTANLEEEYEIRAIGKNLLPPRKTYLREVSVDYSEERLAVLDVSSKSSSYNSYVRVFSLESGELINEFNAHRTASCIALSDKGELLAVCSRPVYAGNLVPKNQSNVAIYDTLSGRIISQMNTGYVASNAVFLPDDRKLLTASANVGEWRLFERDTLKLWNTKNGLLLKEITYGQDGLRGRLSTVNKSGNVGICSSHPDKRGLVLDLTSVGGYEQIVILNPETGLELYRNRSSGICGLGPGSGIVRISDDGKIVAVGSDVVHIIRLAE